MSSEDIRKEQNTQFRLQNLLQKERSPYKSNLVDRIVTSKLSPEEKILRIIDVDQGPEGEVPKARPLVVQTEGLGENPGRVPRAEGADRSMSRQRVRYLKTPIKSGLISWILKEYWAVRQFGQQTGCIKSSLLPFVLHVDPEAWDWYQLEVVGTLVPLIQRGVEVILAKAWQFMPKQDYNQLAAVKELCTLLRAHRGTAAPGEKRPRGLLPQGGAGALFWLIYNNKQVFSTIHGLLAEAGRRTTLSTDHQRAMVQAFDELFDTRANRMTLANFLKTHAMLMFWRYLEATDLGGTINSIDTYFSSQSFDCPDAVGQEIQAFIERQRKAVEDLSRQYLVLSRLHFYLPGQGKPDIAPLIDFNKTHGIHSGDNLALWLLQFHDVFTVGLSPYLEVPLRAKDGRTEMLVPKGVMQAALARLKALMVRLGTASTAVPNFTYQRWLVLQQDPTKANGAEHEIFACLVESAALYTGLARGLLDLIKVRSALAPLPAREEGNQADTNPLPMEGSELRFGNVFNGWRVIDVLITAVRLSFLAGIRLGDGSVLVEWENRDRVLGQIRETFKTIKRIGSPGDLQDAIELFLFEGGAPVELLQLDAVAVKPEGGAVSDQDAVVIITDPDPAPEA